MRRFSQWICCLIAFCLCIFPAEADESGREEVREAFSTISDWTEGLFSEEPSCQSPYTAGALLPGAAEDALQYLNFLRALAGLPAVEYSDIYAMYSQHAAVLLSGLGYASHNPPQPEDMSGDFYHTAYTGASRGNIAVFGWSDDNLLRKGILYLLRDEGEANLPILGHRRWALSPCMGKTGFGFAIGANRESYAVMYAVDDSAVCEWSSIAWPAAGAFPAELLSADTPWSLSLNPEDYDLSASSPALTLTESSSGAEYRFDFSGYGESGYSTVSFEEYGSGPCLIFRPRLERYGIHAYEQNQTWRVEITGLVSPDGSCADLSYTVDMIALFPEHPAAVELSRWEASLAPGESLALSASVLPAYADDLSVTWRSTDETVAVVDETGLVTAVAPGQCEITATASNGVSDACTLTVE